MDCGFYDMTGAHRLEVGDILHSLERDDLLWVMQLGIRPADDFSGFVPFILLKGPMVKAFEPASSLDSASGRRVLPSYEFMDDIGLAALSE